MRYRTSIAKVEVISQVTAPPLSRGTGTLVSDRLVLSALHVVADRSKDPPSFYAGTIRLTFPGEVVTATPVSGCYDRFDDWVLLKCERSVRVPPVPLGELAVDEHAVAWETFGFPDAKPDGIKMVGEVRDVEASYQGRSALQLYSEEASAGDGMPVRGFSGAPCLSEGRLVGMLRSSLLTSDAKNVAGTLFACPTGTILSHVGNLLPRPHPVHGLPGLPAGDLPNQPFRYLDGYTATDAEIFFGRSADIRDLYERLIAPDSDPIVLLYGQSGVGKSSLLDAGLRPRLTSTHEIRLVRRDAACGLSACLNASIEGDWGAFEAKLSRPVIVILDQIEEAFTRPRGDPYQELDELCDALLPIFRERARRPCGRLVLSLRKEWLPEVEDRLAQTGLPFAKVFLQRLDLTSVVEVVLGITRSTRLRRKYRVTVEEGLGNTIADELLADPGSPIAPLLQILMTRLYERALAETPETPAFTRVLYLTVRQEGLHIADFLRRQLEAPFPEGLALHIASGLIDDLLEAHTTTLGTANTRTRTELMHRYGEAQADVDALVHELSRRYLLTNPIVDRVRDEDRTRLAHDTLAPAVRERFRISQRPGQRARRILEARSAEWEDGRTGVLLDRRDLLLVEEGRSGMRRFSNHEERLIEDSRARRDRQDAEERQRMLQEAEAARRVAEAEQKAIEEQQKTIRIEARRAKTFAVFGSITIVLAITTIVVASIAYKQREDVDKQVKLGLDMQREEIRHALENQVAIAGKDVDALAALATLSGDFKVQGDALMEVIAKRTSGDLATLLSWGLRDLTSHREERAILLVEALAPAARGDTALLGALAAILDEYASHHGRYRQLRDGIRNELRIGRQLPAMAPGDWIKIEDGEYEIGCSSPTQPGCKSVGWSMSTTMLGVSIENTIAGTVKVSTRGFLILKHQVSIGEFSRFDARSIPDQPPDMPMTTLSWYQAYAYAAWIGGRLPTEEEWMIAAYGGKVRPCVVPRPTNGPKKPEPPEIASGPVPVNAGQPNELGLLGMTNSAHEWTFSAFPNVADALKSAVERPANRVVRGSNQELWNTNCPLRSRSPVDPVEKNAYLSFRVVVPNDL